MNAERLEFLAIGFVALQWLIVGILVVVQRRGHYLPVRLIASDLLFFCTINGILSSIFLILSSAIGWWHDPDASAILFLIVGPAIMSFVMYLPRSLLPVDTASRLFWGRPVLTCVKLSTVGCASKESLAVGHLTDLHLTVDQTLESALDSSEVRTHIQRSLEWMKARADVLLITGDITDQGRQEEWAQFMAVLASTGYSLEDGNILLVPGNHDLSLVTSFRGGLLSEKAFDAHAYNFISRVLARCSYDWMMMGEKGLISVRSYLDGIADYLVTYGTHPPYLASGGPGPLSWWYPKELREAAARNLSLPWPSSKKVLCSEFLRMAYPMVFRRDGNYLVVGLNSCDEVPESLLNSAFGRLGDGQLRRLAKIIEDAGSRCVVILLHHHVAFPPEVLRFVKGQKSRTEIRALALRDGYRLAGMLRGIKKCVVFHGHKHIGYRAKLENATIISGSSAAYGDEMGDSNCSAYAIDWSGEVRLVEDSPFRGLNHKC